MAHKKTEKESWEKRMIKFRCKCGQKISVPDEAVGKRGKCPKCQSILTVPQSTNDKISSKIPTDDKSTQRKTPEISAIADILNLSEDDDYSAVENKKTESPIKLQKPTKACPYCGEEILAIAKKCKHCGEYLENAAVKDESGEGIDWRWRKADQMHRENKNESDGEGLIVGGYLCGLGSLIFFPPALGLAGTAIGIINLVRGRPIHGVLQIVISATCSGIATLLGIAEML